MHGSVKWRDSPIFICAGVGLACAPWYSRNGSRRICLPRGLCLYARAVSRLCVKSRNPCKEMLYSKCRKSGWTPLFRVFTGFASRISSRAAKVAKYENLWVFIRSDAHVVRAGLNIRGCGPYQPRVFLTDCIFKPIDELEMIFLG